MSKILIGARNSPLSRAQVEEVIREIHVFYPEVQFEMCFVETTGDQDLRTSLRQMNKTDFFTKEIDEILYQGSIRVGVHSAKDLPEQLPQGIEVIAITQGVDSSDSLVLREGETLESLPKGAVIATSSERREEAVKALRSDFNFRDIRGPVEMRLKALQERTADGVVVAEAALIRLNLQHLNRVKLPGETAPLQGKLAVVARSTDHYMEILFSCIDARKEKKSFYLGIDPPPPVFQDRRLLHRPIIAIAPRDFDDPEVLQPFRDYLLYSHFIFTSKNAVRLFFKALKHYNYLAIFLIYKTIIAVGEATNNVLKDHGFKAHIVAQEETAEGVVEALKDLTKPTNYFFWPHAKNARTVISDFLKAQNFKFRECILYDTIPSPSFKMHDLNYFDEIIFTSPKTVDTFFQHTPELPKDKILTGIGPITDSYLAKYREIGQNVVKT